MLRDTTTLQVDRPRLAAAVQVLTGTDATVGDPQMHFLAVLVPVTSGDVTFHCRLDGHIDFLSADCPACGKGVTAIPRSDSYGLSPRAAYRHLHRTILSKPARGPIARLVRRQLGACAHPPAVSTDD